jgi:hypothetical protein
VWFPSYGLLKIKENTSTQDVHLKGNYMIDWKIPGHKTHLMYILYLLLQVLDIVDFCAINRTIYISLESWKPKGFKSGD